MIIVALRSIAALALISVLAGSAHAVGPGSSITFEGKGAGEVVFDGTVHAGKGLTCADCHEDHGFSGPLFEKKRGGNLITMHAIELGRSCGHCHKVSMNDTLNCQTCHRK